MKVLQRSQAIELRKAGHSIGKISKILHVSKSSVSIWVRQVYLSPNALRRISDKLSAGHMAAINAKRSQTEIKEREATEKAQEIMGEIILTPAYTKLLCTVIHFCEGNKSIKEGVVFTNSDPGLVERFLHLFRQSFTLDEGKFRVCVHLHSYHEKDTQLKFWSKVAKIPLSQFIKPYLKPHSGIYKKDGYQGCVSIRYADVKIARELRAISREFINTGP